MLGCLSLRSRLISLKLLMGIPNNNNKKTTSLLCVSELNVSFDAPCWTECCNIGQFPRFSRSGLSQALFIIYLKGVWKLKKIKPNSYRPSLCPCGPFSRLQSHQTLCLGLDLPQRERVLIMPSNYKLASKFTATLKLTHNPISSFSDAVELFKFSDTSAASKLRRENGKTTEEIH